MSRSSVTPLPIGHCPELWHSLATELTVVSLTIFSPAEQRVEIAGGNIPLLPKGSQNK